MPAQDYSEGEPLTDVWAILTSEEPYLLYLSLGYYFEDDVPDPGWHTHLGGPDGRELTIAIAQ